MCIHHRSDSELLGNRADELIYHNGCFRIKSRVRFVTEQIGRIQGDGSCNTYTLLHTSGQFIRILVFRIFYIDLIQKVSCSFLFFGLRPVGEEVHREHDIPENSTEIKQRASLEQNADFLVKKFLFQRGHAYKLLIIIPYLS